MKENTTETSEETRPVRIPRSLHRKARIAAATADVSLGAFVAEAVTKACENNEPQKQKVNAYAKD
jgi:predicted HicB family RNase H-like nuclease